MAQQAMNSDEGARLLTRTVTDLIQTQLHTVADDTSVDSIEIGCGENNRLVAYQTHLGREDLDDDYCIVSPELERQTLSSVPLYCVRGRNEILELAKNIKDASHRKIILSEEEIIADVYIIAAAIALQLMENNGKGMTMEHVGQMLDTFCDTDIRRQQYSCVHPLEHICVEYLAEAEKRVVDWQEAIEDAKQMLLDYCNAWLYRQEQAEP